MGFTYGGESTFNHSSGGDHAKRLQLEAAFFIASRQDN